MPVGIALRFPGGRFHATPWGKHVNEGGVEWPPSPWRLLRTLVAAWKLRLSPEEGAGMARAIARLASPPDYRLPPASTGHTRHYMPLFKETRTLVFDTFLCIAPGDEVNALWPEVQLEEAERAALALALERMGYLGRAESWCEGRLLSSAELERIEPNCQLAERSAARAGMEAVRILGANQDVAVRETDDPFLWPLCAETGKLRGERWSQPPGSKWFTYMRPKNCFAVAPPRPQARPAPAIHVARFALDGPVLPLLTEALSIGELARVYLQGIYGRQNGDAASPVLSGKAPGGQPLTGHGHAFYLATDEDSDGRVDNLTVFARDGFGPAELRAFDRFRTLRQIGGKPDLSVSLTGLGRADDFRGLPVLGPGRKWVSATPFVAVRHAKVRSGVARETAEEQLRLELERRNFPQPAEVLGLERCPLADGRSVRWIEFRRERLNGSGARGSGLGCGFLLRFDTDVTGPLAFGYGCHFGLGQFRAER